MAIEEMILLNMTFDRTELDQVLFTLKDSKYFYPQPASKIVNNVKGVHALAEDNAYTKLLDRLIQVASDMKLDLSNDLAYDRTLQFDRTNAYLSDLEAEIKKIKDVQDQLIEEKDENEKTLEILKRLTLSNVNLVKISNVFSFSSFSVIN